MLASLEVHLQVRRKRGHQLGVTRGWHRLRGTVLARPELNAGIGFAACAGKHYFVIGTKAPKQPFWRTVQSVHCTHATVSVQVRVPA